MVKAHIDISHLMCDIVSNRIRRISADIFNPCQCLRAPSGVQFFSAEADGVGNNPIQEFRINHRA